MHLPSSRWMYLCQHSLHLRTKQFWILSFQVFVNPNTWNGRITMNQLRYQQYKLQVLGGRPFTMTSALFVSCLPASSAGSVISLDPCNTLIWPDWQLKASFSLTVKANQTTLTLDWSFPWFCSWIYCFLDNNLSMLTNHHSFPSQSSLQGKAGFKLQKMRKRASKASPRLCKCSKSMQHPISYCPISSASSWPLLPSNSLLNIIPIWTHLYDSSIFPLFFKTCSQINL